MTSLLLAGTPLADSTYKDIYDNQGNKNTQMPRSQPIAIDIHELIQKQQQALSKILKNIIQKMEGDHMNYKNENNDIAFFIENKVSYYLGKVNEALSDNQSMSIGDIHTKLIIRHFDILPSLKEGEDVKYIYKE